MENTNTITDPELKAGVEVVQAKLKEGIGKYAGTLDEIKDRMKALEQNHTPGVPGGVNTKDSASIAKAVTADSRFADFKSRSIKEMRVPVSDLLVKNTITQESGSPSTPNDTLTQTTRYNGIIAAPERRLRIRDLLPVFPTPSNKVEFTRELSFTNDAAPQDGEGATKAESDITFELAGADVVTVAHIIKSSKQALDDSPYLENFLNNRMRYGVEVKVENQILNGNGTSHAMSGLLDSGNFTAFTPETGDTKLDVLRKAIGALEQADLEADGIVLNPADWQEIELLKDSQERYILGQPGVSAQPRLWGVPVISTNSIASGTFLVGNFEQAAGLWDRQDAVVELGYVNDDFAKNLVTVRAEARLALTVFRPTALRSGTFQ